MSFLFKNYGQFEKEALEVLLEAQREREVKFLWEIEQRQKADSGIGMTSKDKKRVSAYQKERRAMEEYLGICERVSGVLYQRAKHRPFEEHIPADTVTEIIVDMVEKREQKREARYIDKEERLFKRVESTERYQIRQEQNRDLMLEVRTLHHGRKQQEWLVKEKQWKDKEKKLLSLVMTTKSQMEDVELAWKRKERQWNAKEAEWDEWKAHELKLHGMEMKQKVAESKLLVKMLTLIALALGLKWFLNV